MVLLMAVLGSLAGWAATKKPSIAVVEVRIVGVLRADSINLTVPIRSDRETPGAYKLQMEILYAQNVYQAGSRASLRVLVTDESGAREIKSGRLEIDLEGKKQRLNLFRGTLGQFNQGNFHFKIPDDFVGEYELKVRVETAYGRQSLSQKINVQKTSTGAWTRTRWLSRPI
jgi:hypothetical protein